MYLSYLKCYEYILFLFNSVFVAFSILEDHLENVARAIENGIFSIYRVENGSKGAVGDSLSAL
jgi:hypothetical protein